MPPTMTPKLDRLGIRPRGPSAAAAPMFPTGSVRGQERPLLMQFVGGTALSFWFRSIPLTNTSIAFGFNAWYGLREWTIDEIGQEGAVVGYRLSLGPTDPVPAAPDDPDYTNAANRVAWGSAAGTRAAIVVGVNLPIVQGAWIRGPSTIAKLEANQRSGGSEGGWGAVGSHTFHFATGTLATSPLPMVHYNSQSTPIALPPLVAGDRLGVALVLPRAVVNGVTSTDGIVGHCYGELLFAQRFTRGDYNE